MTAGNLVHYVSATGQQQPAMLVAVDDAGVATLSSWLPSGILRRRLFVPRDDTGAKGHSWAPKEDTAATAVASLSSTIDGFTAVLATLTAEVETTKATAEAAATRAAALDADVKVTREALVLAAAEVDALTAEVAALRESAEVAPAVEGVPP